MAGKTQAMRAAEAAAAAGPGRRWFVVQAHANQERLAKAHLVNQGFEVYLPMRLSTNPRARHPITPFFPRYLFVRFDPDVQQWLCICSTVGVHDIIRRAGGMPHPVADAMIGRIQSWETEGVIELMGRAKAPAGPVFKAGDKVTIVEGPFSGLDALVRVGNENDRATLMLTLAAKPESAFKLHLKSTAVHVAALR